MSGLQIEKSSVVYNDTDGNRYILFDGEHPIYNYSKIPMQVFHNNITITELLVEIQEKYEKLSRGTSEHNINAFILNSIFASKIVQSPYPPKFLEIGCTTGLMSWNIISLLKIFNLESHYCGVTDTIGDQSDNRWLDYIAQIEAPCHFALYTSDYDYIMLEKGIFDIVFVNGMVTYTDVESMLKEACRMVAKDGILVIHTASDYKLEEYISKCTDDMRVIPLALDDKIMIIKSEDILIEDIKIPLAKELDECRNFVANIGETISAEEIRQWVKIIDGFID